MLILCVMYAPYLLCIYMMFFFFFKQKTAYEMRISDWSSDVCSSDLKFLRHCPGGGGQLHRPQMVGRGVDEVAAQQHGTDHRAGAPDKIGRAHAELQSLMRISYAVFCLKKKHNTHIRHNN